MMSFCRYQLECVSLTRAAFAIIFACCQKIEFHSMAFGQETFWTPDTFCYLQSSSLRLWLEATKHLFCVCFQRVIAARGVIKISARSRPKSSARRAPSSARRTASWHGVERLSSVPRRATSVRVFATLWAMLTSVMVPHSCNSALTNVSISIKCRFFVARRKHISS